MELNSVLTSLITDQRQVDIKVMNNRCIFQFAVFLLHYFIHFIARLKNFRSETEMCAILSSMWCCILGLFALTSFISRSKTSGNDAYYKMGQTWSTQALFSQNTVNPDSAVNTIPVAVCVRLLTITYAYKLDPQLSKQLTLHRQSVHRKRAGNPGERTLSAGCSKRLSASTECL